MTQNFDWLQWQTKTSIFQVSTKGDDASAIVSISEEALAHFRDVGKTLMKYKYKVLGLSPKGVSPAPYYLHITRSHVTLSESTASGALQTKLVLADGSLLRGGQLADDAVFAHFSEMVHKIQAALDKNEIKISVKMEEA